MTKNRVGKALCGTSSIILSALSVLLLIAGGCGANTANSDCETYTEAADPSPDGAADWAGLEPGLHAAVGSIDRHYFKNSIPSLPKQFKWRGTAWRGEKLSAQLVLWSGEPVHRVTCEFSDFTKNTGRVLPADIARARFVRYVITDEFADGCGYRKPEDYAAFLYPDVLDFVPCFDMERNSARPVWITMHVPTDAEPGVYRSTMTLQAGGRQSQVFEFELDVLPRLLPPSAEWKFHLDLWQNPYAVARIHGVEPWSEAHWEALQPIMKMLADAGQKVITASITKKPWAGQTFDPFDSMIVWTKKTDGGWKYDTTVFDRWVRFMMDLGIDRQINCYSMLPWTSELWYVDEASGREIQVEAEPGSKTFTDLWTPFLKDFRSHLGKMGWIGITNIAMDERGAEEMQILLSLLEEHAPELGIALADNTKSYKTYPDRIKDLCVSHRAVIDKPDLDYRKSKGYPSTYYVCCGDSFPNTFTFSSPAEAVFIGWYAAAAGFDGFLRWSFCSWVEDPLRDSRFRTWPAGDTSIVYPGPRSSIRFERLVEGIQDAEKIRILREEFEKAGTRKTLAKLARLEEAVALFNILEKPADLNALVNFGQKVLEDLSR